MAKRVADFYVLLEPRGSFTRATAVAVRSKRPATTSRQIAVRIKMVLPDGAFDAWTPAVAVDIPSGTFVAPTVEVVEPEAVA